MRFRTGHPKYPMDSQDEATSESAVHGFADKFVWTYTSPDFPMVQVSFTSYMSQKYCEMEPDYLVFFITVLVGFILYTLKYKAGKLVNFEMFSFLQLLLPEWN